MDDNELSSDIIGAAIAVHRALGPGLLESLYEGALCIELSDRGITFARQVELAVCYKERPLTGHLRLDLLVADRVHEAQLLSYLRLTSRRVGLLINFNVPKLYEGVRRMLNGY